MNLLTNARDALVAGGEITIETGMAPGEVEAVRLVVRDTGAGIPPDVVPRIFDPFFTTKPSGTGLGLSVSYGIVRDHKGTLEVESRPGEGTAFILTLPATRNGGCCVNVGWLERARDGAAGGPEKGEGSPRGHRHGVYRPAPHSGDRGVLGRGGGAPQGRTNPAPNALVIANAFDFVCFPAWHSGCS